MSRLIPKTPILIMNNLVAGKRIVVTTHYRIYSASQALRDFLRKEGCPYLLYVSHPLPLPDIPPEEKSFAEVSRLKKITQTYQAGRRFGNLLISSLYEAYLTLRWALASPGRFDLYVGVDNLNAVHGLILKLLGKVQRVVYYTIDYFPTRFANPLLNWIYHVIDLLCVRFADETWNLSPVMEEARRKRHRLKGRVGRQYTVPIGIWYEGAPRKKFAEINQKKLVFVGHLLPHMGVDLVIGALPLIQKDIPNIRLDVIGGGQEEENLKKLSRALKVERLVKFYGWVRDRKRLEKLMSDGAVGMATFNTEILDEKVRNADPGKIKDYLLLGLPVITTDAPTIAAKLEEKQCGVIIKYDENDLAQAVVQLLTDRQRLALYRRNALKFIRQFDYPRLFSSHIKRVLKR